MSRKSKGSNAERELIRLFWKNGWAAIRVAGSGSSGFPDPDVLAANRIRRIAIECKSSKDPVKYVTKEDVSQIKQFSSVFGAEAWLGIRFNNQGWFFMNLEDLRETDKSFMVDMDIAKSKGLTFDQLIKGFE